MTSTHVYAYFCCSGLGKYEVEELLECVVRFRILQVLRGGFS